MRRGVASIRSALVAVGLAALLLAASRADWASAGSRLATGLPLAFGAASLLAVCVPPRAFWAGFATFGWCLFAQIAAGSTSPGYCVKSMAVDVFSARYERNYPRPAAPSRAASTSRWGEDCVVLDRDAIYDEHKRRSVVVDLHLTCLAGASLGGVATFALVFRRTRVAPEPGPITPTSPSA